MRVWAVHICRAPSEMWAEITTEWKPHNGDAAHLVGDGGMIWTLFERTDQMQ